MHHACDRCGSYIHGSSVCVLSESGITLLMCYRNAQHGGAFILMLLRKSGNRSYYNDGVNQAYLLNKEVKGILQRMHGAITVGIVAIGGMCVLLIHLSWTVTDHSVIRTVLKLSRTQSGNRLLSAPSISHLALSLTSMHCDQNRRPSSIKNLRI
jgi:hypothetical protein